MLEAGQVVVYIVSSTNPHKMTDQSSLLLRKQLAGKIARYTTVS